jgi:hypothetical protein
VLPILSQLRHWLNVTGQQAQTPVPYEVACTCGSLLRGFRQASYQVPKCTRCGRNVFILPLSPLPPVVPDNDPNPAVAPSMPKNRRNHRPLLAARLALALVSLALAGLVLLRVGNTRPGDLPAPADDLEDMRFHFQAGRQALADGNFQSAVQAFEIASAIRARHPAALPAEETRKLVQLHRQAALLADLLTESLEEILRRLDGLPEREGQAIIARHYRGKAVAFHSQVRRDASGRYQIDYRLFDGRQEARLDLGNLKLLQRLPLHEPQQLVFGARLAAVRREAVGGWVVSFEPDSGVLLTDPGAAAACCFQPGDAEQLQQVLRMQEAWAGELR